MGDHILESISSLELLPDELFYDIFEYLSVRDLYDGFYHLNRRFRTILASLTNLYGELTMVNEVHSSAFRYFASRIIILNVKHVEPVDVSPFLAIRSLQLQAEPNRIQCQWIQLLPHLEYLSVFKPDIKHSYYSIALSSFLFTNSFPSVHSCRLNLIPYKDKQQWTNVPSLRTLDISIGEPRIYPQILHACPSLVALRIEFTPYFARPPEAFEASFHSSLHQFDLILNSTTFSCCQIIDLLLSLVPNLTYFSVRSSSSDANYINIDSLAVILHLRLPKLRQFYLDMAVQELLVGTILNDDQQKSQQLHPLFNHIKINSSAKNTPIRLIISSHAKIM